LSRDKIHVLIAFWQIPALILPLAKLKIKKALSRVFLAQSLSDVSSFYAV
jgi:hypothetical protein